MTPPPPGPWFPNDMQKWLSSEKKTYWATVYLDKMLLTSSLVQERLDTMKETLTAHFLDTSVPGGSWCTDCGFSTLLLVKLPTVLELTLLDNPLKGAVVSLLILYTFFLTTLSPSSQLSASLFWYSTPAGPFSTDLLWPAVLVEGVSVFRSTVKSAVLPVTAIRALLGAKWIQYWKF